MKTKLYIFSLIAILFFSNSGFTSSSTEPEVGIEAISINLSDVKSLQRGARNFFNYCAGCHSLQYMRYEQIAEDLNISEEQLLDNLIFTDKTPQDLVTTNMLKEDGDRWFGKAPPDLTLVTRRKNPDYVYQFLKSFYIDNTSPTGVNNLTQDGTSMPHILWLLEEQMTAEDYNRFILDTVTFLEYVGEPIQQKRKSLGVWVISFLVLLLVFSYALYKDIWREVK
jgi:ubiquinol-cytochrome c reductase cytochrome c1 subunit|tara:strand:- start:752 stop:1423 length:672 start_codon:yes stop_codon:yes gene_type:complete